MDIIEKLSQIKDTEHHESIWKKWTLEEKRKLLEIYFIICKNEEHLFHLVYNYHGEDSWEDIFRDFDYVYLEDKTAGVKIALKNINEHCNKEYDGDDDDDGNGDGDDDDNDH